jgi:hypothetical protein
LISSLIVMIPVILSDLLFNVFPICNRVFIFIW